MLLGDMLVKQFLGLMAAGWVSLAGELEWIKARPEQGFHQDYLLMVPEQVRAGCVFVVATPTPKTSDDPAEFLGAAKRIATNAGPLIGELGLPVIVPVLPRPPLQVDEDSYINVYFPALSRAALAAGEVKVARMDRQVLAMLEDARGRLRAARGLESDAKAIFVGFSAAGHFATRMAVLHPDRVRGVWAGGMGGHPIVPAAELDGKALTYPVGIADLKEVAGKDFDAESFGKVTVMLVHGGMDMNTSLQMDERPSDSYTFEQAETVREVLGTDSGARLEKVRAIWAKAGAKVEAKVYPEAGHRMTPQMIEGLREFIVRCVE